MKTEKKRIANLLIICGILCILAALGFAIANEYSNYRSSKISNETVARINAAVGETEEITDGNDNEEYIEPEDADELPVVEIDGINYIGVLYFETLDMEMPVIAECDDAKLKVAACRYSGSLADGNLVIAGHNYRNGFRRLKELQTGDRIYLTAMNGKIYEYSVEITEILQAQDIEDMNDSGWELSLYTCTYDGKQRYTVRCRIEKGE